MTKILIVDNDKHNIQKLSIILDKEGYDVFTANTTDTVNETVNVFKPELLLVNLTVKNIRNFIQNNQLIELPIIFIINSNDKDSVVEILNFDNMDYVILPLNTNEVLSRISNLLKNAKIQQELKKSNHYLEIKLSEQVKKLSDMQMETIFSLAKLAQSRDDDTGKHLERVQNYCRILTEYLSENSPYSKNIDKDFIVNITNASPLHDIGKVGISDLILLKPGKLTPEEFEVMKTHTLIGFKTLESVDKKFGNNAFIEMGKIIARSHHERWDGKGYPDHLAYGAIPLAARIMAIADVYDALSTKRVYKNAFPHDECVKIIKEGSDTQFDPIIVDAFIATAAEFDIIRKHYQD